MHNLGEILKKPKNKRLMVIFPHPDDEVFMAGGLMMRALGMGYQVQAILLTRGGKGQNFKNDKKGEGLKKLREEEFKRAVGIMGINNYLIWDYGDGELKEKTQWQIKLKEAMKKFSPGVVVSYGPSGVTGHPDHIAVAKWVFETLKQSKVMLLWPGWPGFLRTFMVHRELREYMANPNLILRLSSHEKSLKAKAIMAYESQLGNWTLWQRVLIDQVLCWREFFFVANYKRKYDFKFVEFKI